MPLKKPLLTSVSSLALLCALAILFPTLAFAQGQYAAGSIGVDVSYPNGSATIPTTVSFGIVGVNGGFTYSTNSSLTAEASHFSNLSFYVNTGLNASSTSTYYQQAVAEAQANGGGVDQAAYYYGYNAGQAALAYAQSVGEIVQTTWWLDVESANTWNSDTLQNQQSLQGEHDALLAGGATVVGVYSTTLQWDAITGGWQNLWPSWGATVLPTAKEALTYSTGHEFTGGPSYLMQYQPAGADVDYDVACLTVLVTPKLTLRLGGLKSGILKLGKRVTAKGSVVPTSLADGKVTLTVQNKLGGKWRKVTSKTRTISASGAYNWKYKPAKKANYRMRATMAAATTHTAAKTPWRAFKVK